VNSSDEIGLSLETINSIGIDNFVNALPDEEVEGFLLKLRALEDAEKYGRFNSLFPDTGPLRRELYTKHMEFFKAGANYRERCFMAGNRVGKTIAGTYETVCHLTGEYPHWWEGRRFNMPIKAWCAGKTNETTRDIIQAELLGNITFSGQRKLVDGTGLIPKTALGQEPGQLSWKAGVADLVDMVKVRHRTGGWSELGLKSYQQGRGSFEGTARHVVWFDEEPPMDVYGEALVRTATTQGLIMLTFTPLEGMSTVVQEFLPKEMRPGGGR
jgi:phage terminase large subunit-like protein